MQLVPLQRQFFQDSHRFKVLVAGRRSGKTTVALIALIHFAFTYPDSECYFFAHTRKQAIKIAWRDICKLIPPAYRATVNLTDRSITLTNGSIVTCSGVSNFVGHRGGKINFAVLDEYQDWTGTIWDDVIRPMLSFPEGQEQGRAVILGTPKGHNHLYEKFHDAQNGYLIQNDQKIDISHEWSAHTWTSAESGLVALEEIESAKRTRDIKRFRKEYEVSWETMSGIVYYNFDPATHIKPLELDPDLPLHIGQDLNYQAMASTIAQVQDGKMNILKSFILETGGIQETCEYVRSLYPDHKRIIFHPDPKAAANLATGRTPWDIIKQNGFEIVATPGNLSIDSRVDCVRMMLRAANGEVTINVNERDTDDLINALQTQTFDSNGQPRKRQGRGNDVDGLLDSLGYLCWFSPLNPFKARGSVASLIVG